MTPMQNITRSSGLVLALLSLLACSDTSATAPEDSSEPMTEDPVEEPIVEEEEVPEAPPATYGPAEGLELTNASTFGGWTFGGQPSEADLATLAERGVTKVIDLRMPQEDRGYDEAAVCADLGLEYVALPFSPASIEDAQVDGILAELNEGGETLLHCASGNRVQLFFAMHRVLEDGVESEVAIADGIEHGLKEGVADLVRTLLATRQ